MNEKEIQKANLTINKIFVGLSCFLLLELRNSNT